MGEDVETDSSLSRRRLLQLSGVGTAGSLFLGEASAEDDDKDDDVSAESIQVAVVGQTELMVGNQHEYTAAISGSAGNKSYFWGSTGEVIGPDDERTATVRFDSPGSHRVSVIVTDGRFDAADTLEVTVEQEPLEVEIDEAPRQVQVGDSATFSADANRDPGNVSYTWTVNGESSYVGSSVTIPFSETGTKTVEVVADDGDEQASASREIDVFGVEIDGWEELVVGGPFEYEAGVRGPVIIETIDWTVHGSADHTVEEKDGGSAIDVDLHSTGGIGISLTVETATGYEGTATFGAEVVEAIQNFRLVQTVENTHVRHRDDSGDVIHEVPDPDFVADREVSIAFELHGEPFEEETSVEFVLDRIQRDVFQRRRVVTSSFELSGDEPENLLESDGIADIYHYEGGLFEPEPPAEEPPIFTLDEDAGRVDERMTLSVEGTTFDVRSVDTRRGDNFTVQQPHTLRIGFVQVQDPEEGDLYGSVNDGLPTNYEGFVDDAIDYLGRMFPTEKVVAYRHDERIEGAYKHEDDWGDEYDKVEVGRKALWYDAFSAKHLLMEELCEQGGFGESQTVDGNGEIPSDTGFDGTVLVTASDYIDYHRDEDACGLALPQDQPEPVWTTIARCHRSTIPHELIHMFLHDVYRDEEQREYEDEDAPLAARTEWGSEEDEWIAVDGSHVRGFTDSDDDHDEEDPYGVRLTFFDLEGGEFHVEQDAHSIMEQPNRHEGDWIDSRAFSRMIEDGFTTTIDPDEEADHEIDCDEWVNVIEGFASVEESGHVSIQAFRQRAGRPMASDDGDVTVEVRDDEGETLSRFTTRDEWKAHAHGDGHETVEVVPFRLPYPEEAAEIRFERPAATTTVDPRAVPLDGVMAWVAPESFVKNPEDRHLSLADKFDSVASQLESDAYQGAYNKLTNDVRPRIREWLQDGVSVPANYYTKADLLALVDETIARLEALYDLHDRDDPDREGRGPPDEHPGRGPPAEHPGRGPPEDDPGDGRGPPDEKPGRGPPDDDDDDPGRSPSDDDDESRRGPPDNDDDDSRQGPPDNDDDGDDSERGPPDDDRRGPGGS